MKMQLNTLPIENFLNKARIAIKSNQKDLNLPLKDVIDLQNSLSIVMTRLADDSNKTVETIDTIEVKLNGGSF